MKSHSEEHGSEYNNSIFRKKKLIRKDIIASLFEYRKDLIFANHYSIVDLKMFPELDRQLNNKSI